MKLHMCNGAQLPSRTQSDWTLSVSSIRRPRSPSVKSAAAARTPLRQRERRWWIRHPFGRVAQLALLRRMGSGAGATQHSVVHDRKFSLALLSREPEVRSTALLWPVSTGFT